MFLLKKLYEYLEGSLVNTEDRKERKNMHKNLETLAVLYIYIDNSLIKSKFTDSCDFNFAGKFLCAQNLIRDG